MPSNDLLPIGEVARRAGLRPSALRYYEEVGLLRPTARVGGRRRYEPAVLDRLVLIRLLRDAGFTIQEMRRLLVGGAPRSRWRPLAELKLLEIDALISEAKATRRLLERALACDCESLEGCSTLPEGDRAHRRLLSSPSGRSPGTGRGTSPARRRAPA